MWFLLFQPVSEWTSVNVVEWMAAINFCRYADVFKSKDIKGSDLLNLDREKLMVSFFPISLLFPPTTAALCLGALSCPRARDLCSVPIVALLSRIATHASESCFFFFSLSLTAISKRLIRRFSES